jgi:SSS family solute:Na+ symporter
MPWQQYFSYGFIVAFANPMFPQLFMRLLTGRDPKSLRQIIRLYPIPVFVVVILMATLGMWGRPVIDGLQGSASDSILPLLLAQYTPLWVTGVLGAAVFAAMMSTMDSQLLSMTTIVVRDFLFRTSLRDAPQARLVTISRLLVVAITAVSYGLALINPYGVIRIAEFAFAGFACLTVPTLAAFYWRRCTAQAAIWSIVVSQAVLIGLTTGLIGGSWAMGFLPGLPAMVVGVLMLGAVSYASNSADARNAGYLDPARAAGDSITPAAPVGS